MHSSQTIKFLNYRPVSFMGEPKQIATRYYYCIIILGRLKGGFNMLTKCKSFADAFIIQTCGNKKQLDYATPRSTNCACSAVFKQNRFNSA